MPRHTQTFKYLLPSQTYSAGSTTTQTLKELPKQYLGLIAHLVAVMFRVVFTPTYTGAPGVAGENGVFTGCDLWDGGQFRFQGGFNHMRAMERMHTGRIRNPDANDSIASASARTYTRVLRMGPPQFDGSPTDFVIPCGILETGELRFKHGALSDLQGTVSAATATVRVVAVLALMTEVRIPPMYQFINQSGIAGDMYIAGQSLYESIAFANSSTFNAFSSGGVGNVRLDFGLGEVVPNIKATDLVASFIDDFASGETGVAGDTENATDTSTRAVNQGTPTALAAVAADLQPILWCPPGARITKLFEAQATARIRWDGSNTTPVLLIGRFLPQPPPVVTTLIGKALARLGATSKSLKIKTLSKQDYNGKHTLYMPWSVKI